MQSLFFGHNCQNQNSQILLGRIWIGGLIHNYWYEAVYLATVFKISNPVWKQQNKTEYPFSPTLPVNTIRIATTKNHREPYYPKQEALKVPYDTLRYPKEL